MEAIVKTDFHFPGQTGHYVGKVRDVYSINDEYLGTYTFIAEGLTEVQLEWGCTYKLFAIPFDASENSGEMFIMEIPALDRNGAAPIEEY